MNKADEMLRLIVDEPDKMKRMDLAIAHLEAEREEIISRMTTPAKLGSSGGRVTADKHGSKHFSEAGKKGMAKRWGQREKLTKLGG